MKDSKKLFTRKNKILIVVVFLVVALIAVGAAFLTWHFIDQKLSKDSFSQEVVAIVDGQGLTVAQFEPYLKTSYDSITQYLGDTVSLDADTGDGTTVAEYIRYDAMEAYRAYRLIEVKAQELGVSLSAEQEDALSADLENFNPEAKGTDIDTYSYITRCDMLYSNLYDYFYGTNGIGLPTDEDVLAWCQSNGIIRAEYILLFNQDKNGNPYDAAGMDAQRQLGEEILNSYATGTSFADLIALYSYGGSQEDTYLSTGDYSQAFINAYYALADEQISGVMTFESGYFIIHRLTIDPDDIRTAGNMTGELFSEQIAAWFYQQEHYTTDAYDQLDAQMLTQLLGLESGNGTGT